MMKTAPERMLNTEMEVHFQRRGPTELTGDAPATSGPATDPAATGPKSRRNGRPTNTVCGDLGEMTVKTPRDRNGTFEPQLIANSQRRIEGFGLRILALYAKGMTTRDIQEVVEDPYGVEVSPPLVSEITTDLDAEVSAWRTRRLDAVWPIVYLDGIVVHVRGENGRVSQHTMYVAIGLNVQGRKELLGLRLGETEGAKFWLSCLTDLEERGVEDMFIACVDGLTGFPEAIRAASPRTKVQSRIAHLVRAAPKYTTETDSREVACDLKTVYQSATAPEAEQALETFAAKWGAKYPDRPAVACEVGRDHPAVRAPPSDPRGDLHGQRDRERQRRDPEVHTRPQAVPECRRRVEAGVPGDPRGVEEVDHAHRGVEGGTQPLRHRVRGAPPTTARYLTCKLRTCRTDTKETTGP